MQLATNCNIVHICDLVQQNCNIIDPHPYRVPPYCLIMRETIPRKNIQTLNYYKNMKSCRGLSDCQELVGPPDSREADNLKTLQSVLYSKNRDLVSSFALIGSGVLISTLFIKRFNDTMSLLCRLQTACRHFVLIHQKTFHFLYDYSIMPSLFPHQSVYDSGR